MDAGIREVKNHFSEYLRRVKQGEIVVITERNVPIARLAPVQEKIQPQALNLVKEGVASWQGGKPRGAAVPPEVPGAASIAALVAEDRR
ncbi:MAG: type II toxin-antitoxin system prevent-host-death family antitoxin [Thermacetogeniaceae bacterium]|jgi:prevent-host-death family protein